MVLIFRNTCGSKIWMSIDNMWQGVLMPHETRRLVCAPAVFIDLAICVDGNKPSKGSIYNLNLMAHYRINDISDNAEFFITREKIRVSVDVSYERVFVEAEKAIVVTGDIISGIYSNSAKQSCLNRFCSCLAFCASIFAKIMCKYFNFR